MLTAGMQDAGGKGVLTQGRKSKVKFKLVAKTID